MQLNYVRLSFPDIFRAVEFKTGDGKPRFNATFLVEPGSENDLKIRTEIKRVANEAYGKKAEAYLKQWDGNSQKFAYLDGNTKEYDGYADMMFLSCHSQVRPGVFDLDKTPLVEEDGRPYAGCYVDAIVNIYAQTGENPGIRGAFSGIRFRADGDAFGGGCSAKADDFADITEGAEAEAFV